MANDRTFFLILLDRSGSMAYPTTFRGDMEGGINSFLDKQKEVPGKCRVTFTQFDTEFEDVFKNRKIQEAPHIQIVPRGGTALLDAMGRSITNLREHIGSLPANKKPDKVVVMIITDGQENSSIKWTRTQVFDLVKECTKDGWEFTYLGANQDAIAEAQKMGISSANTMTYSPKFATATMDSMSANTTSYRTGLSSSVAYSGSQRAAAMGEDDPDEKTFKKTTRSPRTRR